MTEALLQQLACEGLHITPEDVHGLTIRTATVIDLAQTEMQLDLEGEVPEGGDEGSSALTVLEGAVVIAHHKERGAQIGEARARRCGSSRVFASASASPRQARMRAFSARRS